MLHRLSHWLGRNTGQIQTGWIRGRLMVWFMCSGCGRVEGLHEVPRSISEPRARKGKEG